ncbi:MAG: DUF4493 domain-containing protein [Mucinivorans sp.]
MKKLLFLIPMMSLLLGFTGCAKQDSTEAQGEGVVNFKIENDYQISIASAAASRAVTAAPADYNVVLTNTTTSAVAYTGTYGAMAKSMVLAAANYNIKAENITSDVAQTATAGRGQLRLAGSQDFVLATGQTKSVAMVCNVSNIKVNVAYAASFMAVFSGCTVSVVETSQPGRALAYDFAATHATQDGFFNVPTAATSLTVTITPTRKSDGKVLPPVVKTITGVTAAQWHKLTFTAASTGQGSFDITVDDTITSVENSFEVDPFA